MKKRTRKIKITKGEKILYSAAFLCLCASVLLKIFFGASISNLNMSISRIDKQITTEEKKIESLTMKINELTSFDKLRDIVKDMGLAYNNDNIIIIDE